MTFEELKKEASQLAWSDRLKLAQHLLETLHDHQSSKPVPPTTSILSEVVSSHSPGQAIKLEGPVAESFRKLRSALETTLEPS